MSILTDESILQIQQILHHIITKNKRGMKLRTYTNNLQKYFIFFNDLKEDILIKNKTHDHFKIGETFLKELKWVFSDEEALLIYDALCSANDNYKVNLNETENIEKEEKDTCESFCTENATEYDQQAPMTKDDLPTSLAFDEDETQFEIPLSPQKISNVYRNQQKQTETSAEIEHNQNPLLEANSENIFTNPVMHANDSQSNIEMQNFNTLHQQNVTETVEEKYNENKGVNTERSGSEESVTQNLDHTFIEDALRSEIKAHAKATNETLEDNTKCLQEGKQQEIADTNEIPQGNQTVSGDSSSRITNVDSESKVLDFYSPDAAFDSQLGMLMQQQTESNFMESLNLDALQEITEEKVDNRTVFFKKFYRVVDQFNCALNSKIFSKPLDAMDQFIMRTNLLTIKSDTPTDTYYAGTNSSKNIDFQWACEKERKVEREKTLTTLLQKIFQNLNKILNDFSKLHSTAFNGHNFLVQRVFHDVKQYFDERYSTSTDNYITDDGLNICSEFIETAVNNILASEELCQFLLWEEQCFLLAELCNSSVVCQKILDFLLDRTGAILENLVEQAKNHKRSIMQDPQTIETLYIIFPMIQNLVQRYISLYPSKTEKTESSKTKEELSVSELWRLNFDEKYDDFNNLQDSEEEATDCCTDKWIKDLEKIINLTKNRLRFFSHSALEILRVLKEFIESDEVKFSFSESQ